MQSLLKKAFYAFFTTFLAITLLFIIIRLAPGDPIEKILGPEAPIEQVNLYRTQMGLDLPLAKQYVNFLMGILKGDLGKSLFNSKDVSEMLIQRVPATFTLAVVTILFSTIFGVFFGVYTISTRSKLRDGVTRIITLIFLSFPIFSLAPLLVLFFSIHLNWLPVSEWGEARHIILPSLTLIIPLSSILVRVTRNKFLEERNEPWITVLKAKGLSENAIVLRLLLVCLPTVLNVVALQMSIVLAGTMITETIFDIPGTGTLLFEAIQNRDYPVVQGVLVYTTIIYMLIYFFIDNLNSYIDPRIQTSDT